MINVAIIPARGGSKRIPRKNIRLFHGRPMIAWSISAARDSGCFEHIIVSTDDVEIADIARQEGATTPFVRPSEFADDTATTADVMCHATDWFNQQDMTVDNLCCLYATAPFVTARRLRDGLQRLQEGPWDYTFAATQFSYPIQRALRRLPEGGVAFVCPEMAQTRSQDLEPRYHDAGQFYWGRFDAFAQRRPILGERSYPIVLDPLDVQDIDTETDWRVAETLFLIRQQTPD